MHEIGISYLFGGGGGGGGGLLASKPKCDCEGKVGGGGGTRALDPMLGPQFIKYVSTAFTSSFLSMAPDRSTSNWLRFGFDVSHCPNASYTVPWRKVLISETVNCPLRL